MKNFIFKELTQFSKLVFVATITVLLSQQKITSYFGHCIYELNLVVNGLLHSNPYRGQDH